MTRLSSRKLAAVLGAILGVVGLVLGLAVIYPDALTTATEVVLTAIIAISGLGGFEVYRQSKIDEHPSYMVKDRNTIERLN